MIFYFTLFFFTKRNLLKNERVIELNELLSGLKQWEKIFIYFKY